jgi:hypothetical protein
MDNPNQSNTPNHPKKDVFQRFLHAKKKNKMFVSKIPLGTSSLHPEIIISGSQMCKRTTWIHRCARGHWAELCRTKGSFFNGAVGRLPRIFMGIYSLQPTFPANSMGFPMLSNFLHAKSAETHTL